jgi:hypothetical protein
MVSNGWFVCCREEWDFAGSIEGTNQGLLIAFLSFFPVFVICVGYFRFDLGSFVAEIFMDHDC